MKYYKSDNTKLTLRECWRLTRSWRVAILLLFKMFRIRLPLTTALPWPAYFRDNIISETEISFSARNKIKPLIDDFQNMGFQVLSYHTLKEQLGPVDLVVVSFLHPQKEMTARVFYSKAPGVEKVFCVIMSWLINGTFLITSSKQPDLDTPSSQEVFRLVNATPYVLHENHRKILEQNRATSNPRLIVSLEDVGKASDLLEERETKFHVQRGFFVEMTVWEVEMLKQRLGKYELASQP